MLRIAQNDSICAQNRLKLPDIASIPLDPSILEAFKCMKCIIRRHGPTNMSTLLSTVSGFVVNLQHQQLVELESIYLGSLRLDACKHVSFAAAAAVPLLPSRGIAITRPVRNSIFASSTGSPYLHHPSGIPPQG